MSQCIRPGRYVLQVCAKLSLVPEPLSMLHVDADLSVFIRGQRVRTVHRQNRLRKRPPTGRAFFFFVT